MSKEQPTLRESRQPGNSAPFPVVGVGASAGGLEALQQLLRALPPDTGTALVIVQHLAPDHASSLTEILARATTMPVCEVVDDTRVEPNYVYVIPPGYGMVIAGGKLRLVPQDTEPRHRGIDQFFRSLAQDSGNLSMGVVLSGSLTDGTLGLEAIKAEGGITFAQDESAQHDSMPKSALASGCVDFVLPPEGIAQEIARFSRHPYVVAASSEGGDGMEPAGHGRITAIVQRAMGADFTHYKANTMQRRIQRRMMIHKIATLAEYEELLRTTPGEVEALYKDVLISVTSFFRDPEAFETLATKVFPQLLATRRGHEPVRLWTVGCSTGEEAYSLAILFAECAEAAHSSVELQVFATDLSAAGIEKARVGRYPRSIAQDVSPERLRNFFVEEDGHYRVTKSIRERIVFSQHNVLADPPFSRLDFVSCRNLLIYLEPVLQAQLMPLLHYALKPGRVLWLGSSESLGSSRELFEVEDARQKVFRRLPGPTPPGTRFHTAPGTAIFPLPAPGPREAPQTLLHREAERVLLAKYAPPGVVVNARLEVVHFRGETGAFLAPAPGMASLELLQMLREGLLLPVRAALARAGSEGCAVCEGGARVKSDGGDRELTIEVIPLKAGPACAAGFLVLFDEGTNRPSGPLPPTMPAGPPDDEFVRLAQELAATREYLQSVIEQQDAANEELQSANEEAQSANEEMQSVNEELETSKEEIQSSNEELAMVNNELNHRNTELNRLNNDLNNVLASTQLAILIVSRDLRIRRFTPAAEKTLHLVAGDVGRPISDIRLSVAMPGLPPLLREVIDSISPRESDVQDPEGRWLCMRVRPYLTHENKIDGAVVTLVDVDTLRRARDFSENIVASVPAPLVVLDSRLRVKMASHAFYEHFRVAPEATLGRLFYNLGKRQWDIPALRQVLEELLPRDRSIVNYEVRHTFESLGPRIMLLNARRLEDSRQDEPHIILFIDDITERAAAAAATARLAAIVESSEDAILAKNLDGIITSWNRGAERIFGYTGSEIVGQPVTVLFPPERYEEEEHILGQIRRGEPVEHFETVRRRKDGTLFDVSLTASPVMDREGKIIGASVIARDITARKQAEAVLSESEERFRAMANAMPQLAWTAHADGHIFWYNQRWFDYTGTTMEAMEGWGWQSVHDPVELPKVLKKWKAAINSGEPFDMTFPLRGADGIYRPFLTRVVPLKNAEGAVKQWFGTNTDVDELKRAEAALRASEEFKRSIITSSPDCIKVLDLQGNLISLEAGHELLGLSDFKPFVGTSWINLWLVPKDRAAAIAAVEAAAAGGTGTFVGFFRNLCGLDKWWDVAVTPIQDATGQPTRLLAVSRDVTARRNLEEALFARAEQLAKADRTKDEFLAMLAHELRNPLAPLRNAAEILKMDEASPDERTQAQRIINRQIENMSRMLEDLLDVSRITAGKIELRRKPVPLEGILTAAASLVRSTCAAQKQNLSMSLPEEPVYLNADATRLEQVFGNLLANACKYSGDGCHISLRAERHLKAEPPEVVVTVKDDGTGIAPELLPHIFDLFVQASRTLDRSHGGLGIGLTLVQRLVTLHGGRIEAKSEGDGRGAEFVVHLPILTEAPPPDPLPASPPAQPARDPARRILIVDDNTDSARTLATLQKRRGHETRTAFTGPDAVIAAAEFLPEVVLLDIGLPGMDGFEVARRIRAIPALADALLIAMSGYGREEDRAEAKSAGFDAYMVKPVDLGALRDWIHQGRQAGSNPLPGS